MIRRNRGRVHALKINGEWVSESKLLGEYVTDHFKCLFGRVDRDDQDMENGWGGRKIDVREGARLVRVATLDEVRRAVFGMKRFGSPGPDGIQAAFYQDYWDIVGRSVTNLVNNALRTGRVPVKLLNSFIALIPKKDNPEGAGDFRPITLLNVVFKIISKVIVNRLRPIMTKLVEPY